MAFAALLIPGMAAMTFTVIDNIQYRRGKSGLKPLMNIVGDAHIL